VKPVNHFHIVSSVLGQILVYRLPTVFAPWENMKKKMTLNAITAVENANLV
jgi:hypothetical protein